MTTKPSQIVAEAAQRLRERESSRLADRQAAIEALEGTRPPSPETVLKIVDECLWSVDELQSTLELRAQRREWQAILAREPEHQATIAEADREINAALEAMNKAIAAARVTCSAVQQAARARLDAAQAGLRACNDVRVKLLETSGVLTALQTAANDGAHAAAELRNNPAIDLYAERRRLEAAVRATGAELERVGGERAEQIAREGAKEQAELDRINAMIDVREAAVTAAQQRVRDLEAKALTAC